MQPLDFDNLDKMIAERYISVQKHPDLNLYIYNYTKSAQFDRVWNNETLQCRGLIMDGDRNIVSRPFPKFFNWGEIYNSHMHDMGDAEYSVIKAGKASCVDPVCPDNLGSDFTVTEKMDGSLGISYFDPDGKMYIATRGSFVSDQAKKANKMLEHSLYRDPLHGPTPDFTYLFEIIYPDNRIVVNYQDREELVLLTIIETATGLELTYPEVQDCARLYASSVVPRYDGITDFDKIEQKENSEGYVVHFPSTGLRFKIKFDEYVRLHKILTGINAKRIWEILSTGGTLDEIVDRVPDEFFDWVKETEAKLKKEYRRIKFAAEIAATVAIMMGPDRKTQAQYIMSEKETVNTSVVFAMLDGKPYDQIIWKSIKPAFETPFKVDEL